MCASVCVLAALLAFLGALRRARVSTCGKHRSCMWKMVVYWNVKNGDELSIQAFKWRPNTKPNILLHDRLVHTGGKSKTNATSVIMHPHSRTHNGEKSEQGPKLNLICGFAADTLDQRTSKNKHRDNTQLDKPDMWVRGRYTAAADRPASCSIPAGEWASKWNKKKTEEFWHF